MERSGKCLCGAVRFTAQDVSAEASACHCGMCLRWSGGPFLSVMVKSVEWADEDALGVIVSSDWAERGFCKRCGSSLYYRLTSPERYRGPTFIAFGALDERGGIILTKEWFVDRKPEGYATLGARDCFTEAEALAMLADEPDAPRSAP
jgi:hypothetical protein